jgi:mono/diheme cytochrome c family protein
MNRERVAISAVLVVVGIGLAGLLIASQPAIPPLPSAEPQSADQPAITRGARLAAVGDCSVCHTAKGGKTLAGGLKLNTPFGAIYSTNITPDRDTGIGTWSADAFKRAMREGVSRDGHLLYPAFPYQHFTQIRDSDLSDLYAYLMSRYPVQAVTPGNHLVFPLNFRPLIAGWNLLFLTKGERSAEPTRNAEWNRGRYLVDGLGHCAACHSPINRFGAEKGGQAFSGGSIDGWDAPALTRLSEAPTPWTHEQLVSYLRTGLASEHGAAAGPMRPVTIELADAPTTDVEAIATYLMSLHTQASPAPVQTQAPQAPALDSSAQALFTGACAACHGAGSPMSVLGARPSLVHSTSVNADSPNNTIRMILEGNGWDGSQAAHFMPAFGDALTDTQVAELAHYLRAQFSTGAPWSSLDGNVVARIRKETPAP